MKHKKHPCRLCRTEELEALLDFGPQPVSSRFISKPHEPEYSHPMSLGQCGACGLLQLIDPMPSRDITPLYDWITYREPDQHLAKLAEIIRRLPGITPQSLIYGVGETSELLLKVLQKQGLGRIHLLDAADLAVKTAKLGNEVVQEGFTEQRAQAIAAKRGKADLVVSLRIFEHAYTPPAFAGACKELLNPGGYWVNEVPSTESALEQLDYTALWEDHILYFTQETFRRAFAPLGFDLKRFEVYPYLQEDSLVAIAQSASGKTKSASPVNKSELDSARAFAGAWATTGADIRKLLAPHQAKGGVAMLGAGHRAGAFINLFGLKDELKFVVDDDPRKKGLLMPGSRLPILGSEALAAKGISLCLLGISPNAETRVMERNKAFTAGGGTFLSICPQSPRAMLRPTQKV